MSTRAWSLSDVLSFTTLGHPDRRQLFVVLTPLHLNILFIVYQFHHLGK
jgi:hypothetical protein